MGCLGITPVVPQHPDAQTLLLLFSVWETSCLLMSSE